MLRKSVRVSEPNWIALHEREANVQRSILKFSLTVRKPLTRFEREGVVGAFEYAVVNEDFLTSIEDRAVSAVAAAVRIEVPETLDFHVAQFDPIDALKVQRGVRAMAQRNVCDLQILAALKCHDPASRARGPRISSKAELTLDDAASGNCYVLQPVAHGAVVLDVEHFVGPCDRVKQNKDADETEMPLAFHYNSPMSYFPNQMARTFRRAAWFCNSEDAKSPISARAPSFVGAPSPGPRFSSPPALLAPSEKRLHLVSR